MEQIITALLHNYWWLLLAALGVPTAVTGFLIRRFEKSLDKRISIHAPRGGSDRRHYAA